MNITRDSRILVTMVFGILFSYGLSQSKFPELLCVYFLIRFSGAWLIFPSYIIYVTGSEIIQGLAIASGGAKPANDDVSFTKAE